MNLKQILTKPIPDQTHSRTVKPGYRGYPLLIVGQRNNEPLVDISTYGIAGQAYYSRPNSATGQPIPGIPPAIHIRQGIAQILSEINYALQQSHEVEELLGRKVELYVDEGYRDTGLQTKLYDDVFPRLIREQHPSMSAQQILARRNELSAKPAGPRDSPAPHATGAAFDIRLRY